MKREEIDRKQSALVIDGREEWKRRAEERRVKFAWVRKSHAIAVQIMEVLKRDGLSQKALAERMGVSPQQVNKIVKGSENLTLETVAKCEVALGVTLISINGPIKLHSASAVADEPTFYDTNESVADG